MTILTSVLIAALLNTSQPDAAFDCNLLLGTWAGEHTFKSGTYSAWKVTNKNNGEFEGLFYDKEGKIIESQAGQWVCDGRVVSTNYETKDGKVMGWSYRILNPNETTYKYQVFRGKKNGPIFQSHKSK